MIVSPCVQVLARTDAGREALWKVNAPTLLKKGYEEEQHPGVCAAMEAAARDFMFEGMAELEEEQEGQEGQASATVTEL